MERRYKASLAAAQKLSVKCDSELDDLKGLFFAAVCMVAIRGWYLLQRLMRTLSFHCSQWVHLFSVSAFHMAADPIYDCN